MTWSYLRSHPKEGLIFTRSRGVSWSGTTPAGIIVYTDSSFAAGEQAVSQGAVMAFWNGALLFWRSARQPFPTLSTTDSELLESVEGLVVGDALDVLLREEEWKTGEDYPRAILVANMAATVLLGEAARGSSWRPGTCACAPSI